IAPSAALPADPAMRVRIRSRASSAPACAGSRSTTS
ncbi:MAG: hypothetical protein RL190_1593, partial [Actinomycetota bacterium]